MKKFFTQSLMLMAFAAVALSANAKEIDLGEMQLDTDYEIKAFNSYIGTFTPTTDGTIIAVGTNSTVLEPYHAKLDDMEAEGNHIEVIYDNYYGDKQYHFNVTAGTTYYFYEDFAMNAATFRLTMDSGEGITLAKTTPEAGSVFSVSGGGLVSVQFNRGVHLDGTAQIIAGENKATVAVNGQNIYSMEIKEPLFAWLNNGSIKGGDKFIVRLTNVVAAEDSTMMYGEDGIVDIEYIIGEMPIQLTDTVNASGTFKSYYMPTDSTGIVTITFDGEVSSALASLSFGSTDVEGDYYYEELTPVIDGCSIKIDLTGKQRDPENMVASGLNYGNMTLNVNKVLDKTGQHAYSAGQGTIGGYSFIYDKLEVVTADVFSEFIPASGATLTQENASIEIWIADEVKLSYEGVKFACEQLQEPLVVLNYTREIDEYEETAAILTVPVPGELFTSVDEYATVTVTLNNLQSADGIDHTQDVMAEYHIGSSAIEKVLGDEVTEFTVYNTQGILILTTTQRNEVKNLPQGIYIINGEKFILTK